MSTDSTATEVDTQAESTPDSAVDNQTDESNDENAATGTRATPDSETNLTALSASEQRSQWVQVIGLLGVGIIAAGFWLAAEWMGLLAVAVIGLTWYILSNTYAVAIGHAMFLPVAPRSLTPEPAVLIAEVGLVILLLAPATTTGAPERFIGVYLVSLLGLSGLAVGAYRWSGRLWIGAVVLVGVLGIAGYGLYRYEQVRLGLVDTETDSETQTRAGGENREGDLV